MDVAAFVGFASAGPVGVPVAVDDEVRFREVFGPDLPLAWDTLRGEMVHAHLGPAVTEFFRNGGRRCWIVRAGDEATLEAASFRVPGMLHGRGRTLGAAFLLASSPGSWADRLSLYASLQASLVPTPRRETHGVRMAAVSPDLLKLEWPEDGTVAFFPPPPGRPERDRKLEDPSAERLRPFAHGYWFRTLPWSELQPVAQRTVFLAGTRQVPLQPVGWQVDDGAAHPHLDIHLAAADTPEGLQPGTWLRIDLPHPHPGDEASGGVEGFMAKEKGDEADAASPSDSAGPPPSIPSGGGASASLAPEIPAMWSSAVPLVPSDATPFEPLEGPTLSSPDAPLPVVPGEENGGGDQGVVGPGHGNEGGGNQGGGNPGEGNQGGGNQGGGNSGEGNQGGGNQGGGNQGGGNQGGGNQGGGNSGEGNQGGGNQGGGNSGEGNQGGGNQGGGNSGEDNQGGGNQGGGNSGEGNQGGGNQGGGNQGGGNQGGGNQGGGNQGGGNQGGGNQGGGNQGGGGKPEPALLGRRGYLLVDDVRREQNETIVTVRQAWRTLHHAKAPDTVTFTSAQASLVSVELWTRSGDGSVLRLPDVGLVPQSPRFLGNFPPDQSMFAPTEQLVQSSLGPSTAQLSTARMRLAAPDSRVYALAAGGGVHMLSGTSAHLDSFGLGFSASVTADDAVEDEEDGGFQAYLPLGVPTVLRDDYYQAAYTSGASTLERDGVGKFAANLFLDEKLADENAETLLETAFHYSYVAEPPQPPVRMHSLLPVDEVSLLAVPDAVHTGWALRTVEVPAPAPPSPYLLPIGQPDGEGRILVGWSTVGGALEYELQDSPDPRFRAGAQSTRVAVPADAHPDHTVVIRPRPCPDRLYFRIRVRTLAGLSAWSQTLLLDLPGDAFQGCGVVPLAAPVVTSFIPFGDRLAVFWAPAAEDEELANARSMYDRCYRVESSPEPTFGLPELVYEGKDTQAELWAPLSGTLFFRAASWLQERPAPGEPCPCAPRIVEESPWSTTLDYGTEPTQRWEMLSPEEYDGGVTRDVHVAMLRFCAARSDCFSVLALPRHYREPQALEHAAALTAVLGGIAEPGDVGARTLSFGALYHPWTLVRGSAPGESLRALPPDGATVGVMAARANELGAWAAPANRPLAGVAILDPKLPESARATFLGRKVNAVARFPRGFMTWSEETLSDDPDLRGVGVRRLLILLRRLAVREGNTYVFQPNNERFRRLVQRQFDALLGDLYVRGAFKGRSHAEGYRVVTDDTVNPPENVDQGRLIVELRVAPSRPMAFLTVRLVQAGAGITVQEA
jgi:hypothetical protein